MCLCMGWRERRESGRTRERESERESMCDLEFFKEELVIGQPCARSACPPIYIYIYIYIYIHIYIGLLYFLHSVTLLGYMRNNIII